MGSISYLPERASSGQTDDQLSSASIRCGHTIIVVNLNVPAQQLGTEVTASGDHRLRKRKFRKYIGIGFVLGAVTFAMLRGASSYVGELLVRSYGAPAIEWADRIIKKSFSNGVPLLPPFAGNPLAK
jgi:hypothetical protein